MRKHYAICQRDGLRYPRSEMVVDPRTNGFVHKSNYDGWHPKELPPTPRDGDPKPFERVSKDEPVEEIEDPWP